MSTRRGILTGMAAVAASLAAGTARTTAGAARETASATCVNPSTVAFVPRLFELRSYVAQPGRREELIGMFEDIFLDAYQAGGARIVGTFRSLDEPDRWVWMRAFPDAASRGPALKNFYGGEVWRRNADACNATIADIAEAMLLREVSTSNVAALCSPQGRDVPRCLYELAVYPEAASRDIKPPTAPGMAFITDQSDNSYPRQHVRADAVFVTLSRFASAAEHEKFVAQLPTATRAARSDVARLVPCSRSALR